jgi:hypothetical protein
MRNRIGIITIITCLTATVSIAAAQHEHGAADLTIIADGPGGGATLEIEYPFDERDRVRVTPVDPINFPGLFSSTSPGFIPGEGDGVSEFELTVPTEIEVELVDKRGDVSFTIPGNGTITNPGETVVVGTHSCQLDVDMVCENGTNDGTVCLNDGACMGGGTCTAICEPDTSALHSHGEFIIDLMTPDSLTFGEGEITFQINEGSTAVGYLSSEPMTLKVSNGPLPGLEPANEDEAKADNKCRKAVVNAATSHIKKRYQLIGKCLDAVFGAEHLGKKEATAAQKCDVDTPTCSVAGTFCLNDDDCPGGEVCQGNTKSLVAYILKDRNKQIEKLDKACDKDTPGSFAPFTESNIHTHLGMAACRTEELAGATYNNSVDEMVEVLSACDEDDKICLAGPNAGLGCEPTRCDAASSSPGLACTDDVQCPGGACAAADDCDAEAVEEEVVAAFPCLKMSQIQE